MTYQTHLFMYFLIQTIVTLVLVLAYSTFLEKHRFHPVKGNCMQYAD